MKVSLSRRRQTRAYNKFLSFFNTKCPSGKSFLGKALYRLKDWEKPKIINTDKAPAYEVAIKELKDEGKYSREIQHRQIKYLNNIIEADHGKIKQLIKPTLGFKSLRTAYAPLKAFELMRMFKKGQMRA